VAKAKGGVHIMTNAPGKFVYLSIFVAVALIVAFADSGFVKTMNSVSNVLLSVLTAGYVFLTYWILKSTRRSIVEQTRPYVIASLPLKGQQILLSIRNIGNRPAFDVKIRFTPSLETLGGEITFWKPLLTQSFLPPDHEIHNPVALAFDTLDLDPTKRVFQVQVEYSDSDQIPYATKLYSIDLNTYVFKKIVVETSKKD